MGTDIATGASGPTPDAVQPSPRDSGLAGITPIVPGQLAGPTYGARDTTGEFQAQMAAGEADLRAAQAAGMEARDAMLAHYAADIAPIGTTYGLQMDLPQVPEQATGAANDFLYPPPPDTPGYFGGDVPGR